MSITPVTPGQISPPNDLTEVAAGEVSAPNSLSSVTAGSVSAPNDLAQVAAGTVSTPNSLSTVTAGTIGAPNSLTSTTAGAVSPPATLTPVTAEPWPYVIPRESYYYDFYDVYNSCLDTNQKVIPNPLTDEVSIKFSTGSSLSQMDGITGAIVSQSDGSVLEFRVSYKGLTGIYIHIGGNSALISRSLSTNRDYEIQLLTSEYKLYRDGVLLETESANRGSSTGMETRTIIGGEYDPDDDSYSTFWREVLYNVSIEPLNATSFTPVKYYIDDNSETVKEFYGGVDATIIDYSDTQWQTSP